MPFEIIRNDITKVHVDAIVNAANTHLQGGSGVCGAIFNAAGAKELQKACDIIGDCDVGKAVITKGYMLPAKYVIHTVGPIWHGGNSGEEELLYDCYQNSLELAKNKDLKSIAFPLISSGIYGYPKDKALRVAMSAISNFLIQNDMMVYLVVFDKSAFLISEKLFNSITEYIDDNYVEKHDRRRNRELANYDLQSEIFLEEKLLETNQMTTPTQAFPRSLDDLVDNIDDTFSQMLLRLIDEKGKTDVEVYKRANVDRKLFSKIRSNREYSPSKRTAIAFAIALELTLDETKDLLIKAGFALSHSSKFDIIIEYFINEGNYNIFEINEALFVFEQSLLGV